MKKVDALGVSPEAGAGLSAGSVTETVTASRPTAPYREPLDGDTIVVWFSCGAASAVAAKLIVRCYGHRCNVRVVNNFIAQEDTDNRRFLLDVEHWLGMTFENASCTKYPAGDCEEVWERERYMSGTKGAPCTKYLKKRARAEWEDQNHVDWMVMGFTADEVPRHTAFVLTERMNVLPILIEAGLTKEDCFTTITAAGIELPLMYRLGYPNANCIGCVKATSPTYWNHVRQNHPEVFANRAEQSRRIGCKLVRYKGARIYLDELPENAVARPMKSMKMPECSIFCEEPVLASAGGRAVEDGSRLATEPLQHAAPVGGDAHTTEVNAPQ